MKSQKKSNNSKSVNNSINSASIEKERFTKTIGQHIAFLLELRKQGSANLWLQSRARIMNQLYTDMRFAYHSATLTWNEYRDLLSLMREQFSHESLLGVKQLSIFDQITDEDFVKYNTNPD